MGTNSSGAIFGEYITLFCWGLHGKAGNQLAHWLTNKGARNSFRSRKRFKICKSGPSGPIQPHGITFSSTGYFCTGVRYEERGPAVSQKSDPDTPNPRSPSRTVA